MKKYIETMDIKSVYEKYKHLDDLLSDERWMNLSEQEGQSRILDQILYDLWQAIRMANLCQNTKEVVTADDNHTKRIRND